MARTRDRRSSRPPARRDTRPTVRPRRRSAARSRRRDPDAAARARARRARAAVAARSRGVASSSTSAISSCANANAPTLPLERWAQQPGGGRLGDREPHRRLAAGARRHQQPDVELTADDRRGDENRLRARREATQPLRDELSTARRAARSSDTGLHSHRVPLCQIEPLSASARSICAMKSGLPSVCR